MNQLAAKNAPSGNKFRAFIKSGGLRVTRNFCGSHSSNLVYHHNRTTIAKLIKSEENFRNFRGAIFGIWLGRILKSWNGTVRQNRYTTSVRSDSIFNRPSNFKVRFDMWFDLYFKIRFKISFHDHRNLRFGLTSTFGFFLGF